MWLAEAQLLELYWLPPSMRTISRNMEQEVETGSEPRHLTQDVGIPGSVFTAMPATWVLLFNLTISDLLFGLCLIIDITGFRFIF